MHLIHLVLIALLTAAGMAWQVGWSLLLGFVISGLLQVLVSRERMVALLGRDRPRDIALAAGFGAASSSCSYAAVSVMRTLLGRGAALTPALAFVFASTNLVVELGLVLLLLLGWQFMAAEWLGGVVLVVVLAVLVRLTRRPAIEAEARRRAEASSGGHDHQAARGQGPWSRATWTAVAGSVWMDWRMLWKDLAIGFLAAGFIAVFVPHGFWADLFLAGGPAWLRVPLDALIGPLVAMVTFVCSIGNVPLAAVLWGGGASFGGVIAFLYGDLIVLPLLDAYRRNFGLPMAIYMGLVFYATMVVAAVLVDLAFAAVGLAPKAAQAGARVSMTSFSLNYTFWFNLASICGGIALWRLRITAPVTAAAKHCCH